MLLTESEARAAYRLAKEGYEPREAAVKAAPQPSVQRLARADATTMALPMAAGGGTLLAGGQAVGGWVLAALPVAAVVAIAGLFLLGLAEEIKFSRFVRILEENGFITLLNPLGACIGACHASSVARATTRAIPWELAEPRAIPWEWAEPRAIPWEWTVPRTIPRRRLTPDEVEKTKEKVKEETRPKPKKEPEPEKTRKRKPEPKEDPRMDPFLPRPDEERPRRRRCTVEEIEPKFGRTPCHSDFAKTFSGTRREFRVTEPDGGSVDFDAKRGENLYEVKTGYGWMTNPNLDPIWQQRRREVLEDFLEQSGAQLYIAHKCDYHLDWYFNSRSVAEYFQSLLEPPVKWKSYNCDTDSDHTW
jgi:hypothetical protein